MSPPPAQPTPPELQVPGWSRALFVGALLSTFAAVWTRTPIFMVDDAWFYLQIARNIALGLGSTFDGEVATNGYHPLWQGIVAGLALISTQRETLLLLALATQFAMVLGALWWLWRGAIRVGAPYPICIPIGLLLTQYSAKGWLSEGPLTVLVLAAVLNTHGMVSGVFLGLLFLSRLDTIFFAFAFVLFRQDRRHLLLGAALVVAPWVVWTVLTTGHVVPVSGSIKSTFPFPDFSSPISKIGWTGLFTGLGSAWALGLAARRPLRRVWLGSLGLGGLLHVIYTALFTGPLWSTFVPYYWIIATVATALAIGESIVTYLRLLPSLSPERGRALIGLLLVFLAGTGAGRAVRSVFAEADPTIELARWIGTKHPQARILVLDAPGRIAWFSGRPVFAMDGLTRSYGFSDEVGRGITTWAEAHGITHLLSYDVPIDLPWCSVRTTPSTAFVTFYAPKGRRPAGSVQLNRDAAVQRLVDQVPADINAASLYPWPL